jgi:hypothetical protein
MSENAKPKWYSFRGRLFLANSLEAAQRMMNRHRFRFSLGALLLAMAAVSLFLGYAQWRRQFLLRQVKELEAYGVRVQLRDRWANLIWPEVAKEATYTTTPADEKLKAIEIEIAIESKSFNWREAERKSQLMYDQLDALGVERLNWNDKIKSQAWVPAHTTLKKNYFPTH